jgi:hypothetical protein
MEWKHPVLPVNKKSPKHKPSTGQAMVTVPWDSQVPILEHYQERGTTINSVGYTEMLQNC